MKRSRSSEGHCQELIDALDGIITPQQCQVEYDPSIAGEMHQLRDSIVSSDSDLQGWSKIIDRNETPGGTVERSSVDKRYILSLLCINMGRIEELRQSGGVHVIKLYSEAMRWHPDSLEAGYRLGVWLRHTVTSQEELDEVQRLWLQAHEASSTYTFSRRGRYTGSSSVPYGSFNRMIQSREKKIMKELTDMLILHFCQQDELSAAKGYLKTLRYQYKLSQAVLCYDTSGLSSVRKPLKMAQGNPETSVCSYAGGVDSAVPACVLRRLQYVFRPDSPFWAEHNYDFFSNASRSVGYFSYLFPFRDLEPANVVEQAVSQLYDTIYGKFPEIISRATIAEWWVHSRPHSCGHQFHFDSDETLICAGHKAQHPVMTCILYLTPDAGLDLSIGGPTVVTNQTLQSEGLATEGIMFLPKENRMIVFDAKYLHGVVPGRGVCPGPKGSRRVTFMVGFWEKIQSKDRVVDCPGPGQPFPGRHVSMDGEPLPRSQYTWPAEMEPVVILTRDNLVKSAYEATVWIDPILLPNVWEPVDKLSEDFTLTPDEGAATTQTNTAHYSTCFQGF